MTVAWVQSCSLISYAKILLINMWNCMYLNLWQSCWASFERPPIYTANCYEINIPDCYRLKTANWARLACSLLTIPAHRRGDIYRRFCLCVWLVLRGSNFWRLWHRNFIFGSQIIFMLSRSRSKVSHHHHLYFKVMGSGDNKRTSIKRRSYSVLKMMFQHKFSLKFFSTSRAV